MSGAFRGFFKQALRAVNPGREEVPSIDIHANLLTRPGGIPNYEDPEAARAIVEHRFLFKNITTATTTICKQGPGVLHAVIINKAVLSTTISLFDNNAGSGTSMGIITFGAALLSDPPLFALYDIEFATGLTVITSGATDITVSYR